MIVSVNGRPETVPDKASVALLLEQAGLRDRPCAVEVNKAIIPKNRHADHELHDGDTVEIVTFVGGG